MADKYAYYITYFPKTKIMLYKLFYCAAFINLLIVSDLILACLIQFWIWASFMNSPPKNKNKQYNILLLNFNVVYYVN